MDPEWRHGGPWHPGKQCLPAAVNETGQVVGYSYTGNVELHAFSWTAGGGMVDLGTLGGTESTAAAVNSTGQVVGWSTTAGDALTHAFSWTADGGMVGLPELAVGGYSPAVDVNNHGQVVGSSAGHATMWVLPVTVTSALDQLIAQVTAYGLPNGLTNALTVKLEAALASWQRGRSNAAVNEIGAFIREVNAKRGRALTDAQADTLIRMAEVVVLAIHTATPPNEVENWSGWPGSFARRGTDRRRASVDSCRPRFLNWPRFAAIGSQ